MAETVAGVVLAGGRSRRMGGGDKALIDVDGQTLLGRVIERVHPQVVSLVLSVNGNPQRFTRFGLPILPDVIEGNAGPLAGILSALEWVRRSLPDIRWMASVAVDTPLVPEDFVARLLSSVSQEEAEIGCAVSGAKRHPVLGLWPVGLAGELRTAMVVDGIRKVDQWTARYKVADVCWPIEAGDPFLNVNAPDDIERLHRALSRRPTADSPR
jgi:molybdopterin-guanine dinucleotide biosynthesis protein A